MLMLPGTGILVNPSSLPTSVCLLVIRGQKQLSRDQMNLALQGRVPHLEAGPSQVPLSILKGSSRNSSWGQCPCYGAWGGPQRGSLEGGIIWA